MAQKASNMELPTYLGSSTDGERFIIDGVNVWDHKWIPKNTVFEVIDPRHKTKKEFLLYTILNDNTEIKFIAGEFSNCMWGFYRPPL